MTMKWCDHALNQVVSFCHEAGTRTFSLREFWTACGAGFQAAHPENRHVEAKVRQQLQVLRNEGIVTFLDNSGHYTYRGGDLLSGEVEETKAIDLSRETPERREYLVETYVRNVTWARRARERLGDRCVIDGCVNTFVKDDGERYIEVHHIVPLCQGGEDGEWNLAVLCAHHHRMAHYADEATRIRVERQLLQRVGHYR